MSNPTIDLLERLERAECRLLTWGAVEGAFSLAEVLEHANVVANAVSGPDGQPVDPEELVTALLERKLLWRVTQGEAPRYRTRMAEAVRLFARLRQILIKRGVVAWRGAPRLVADYRLLVQPREVPRRDIPASAFLDSVKWTSEIGRAVAAALLTDPDGTVKSVSGFQARATARIAETAGVVPGTGTVVCAGTGSGKTLAFYLPAFASVAPQLDSTVWMKCLAIYPRNELLKDQLRAALATAARARPALENQGKRPIRFGALYSDIPRDAKKAVEWPLYTNPRGIGRLCAFVACPGEGGKDCGEPMVWLETDRKAGNERLVCSSKNCSVCIEASCLALTRKSMLEAPPDFLFTSTEMLNQRLSDAEYAPLFGIGIRDPARRPYLLLLDEAHSYEGSAGAHVALLLRRWQANARARPHVVGLSATLGDASRFFADLAGLNQPAVAEISPTSQEFRQVGSEYLLALRGDATSGASLLSTSIQALLLLRRILAPGRRDPDAGSRVFAFADNLDVINRLYFSQLDAEGWRREGVPNPQKPFGSLANLRASTQPDARARDAAGQNWGLPEQIGHVLAPGSRATVTRTSSQDSGVDRDSEVVVATSSLEVGFDDPDVGGVLQHKAPRSGASFLQRKGRAGRRIGTRPWTVVVFSDFGRDRIAYQSYEQVFSPSLPPRVLPLGNRAVLRMQATYALFDWLAQRVRGPGTVRPWNDLSGPVPDGPAPWQKDAFARQGKYAKELALILDDEAVGKAFAQFVATQLRLDESEVLALLWEPPRAVVLEAVPTLLRRLETQWKRQGGGTDLTARWSPLPDFVQKALFGELMVPEVEIQLPRSVSTPEPRIESMLIGAALREFAPGRVSRRFGNLRAEDRYWIDPGGGTSLPVEQVCAESNREYLGVFSFRDTQGKTQTVDVFRPHALKPSRPPVSVDSSSNGFPQWKTEVEARNGGNLLEITRSSEWSKLVPQVVFHTHVQSQQAEVRRFTPATRVSLVRGGVKTETQVTFASPSGAPAALGFCADVDALSIPVVFPKDLLERCTQDAQLLRSLRVARFFELVRRDPRLDGLVPDIQREQVAQAWLSAACGRALENGSTLKEAEQDVLGNPSALAGVLTSFALWAGSDDDGTSENQDGEEDTHTPVHAGAQEMPKRLRELIGLSTNGVVVQVLHEAAQAWSETPSPTWEGWLRLRLKATLGAAWVTATGSLCPQMDAESVVVDLEASAEEGPDANPSKVWLNETTMGGGGLLEDFERRFAADPRRFLRLLEEALGPSDLETICGDLERIVTALDGAAHPELAKKAEEVRSADTHQQTRDASQGLRRELAKLGIAPTPSLLISVHARLLAPGTTPKTDHLLAKILARWRSEEARLGIEVDLRTVALAFSADPEIDSSIGIPAGGQSDSDRRAWRSTILRTMLWERGFRLRSQALRTNSAWGPAVECDRFIVLAAVGLAVPVIALADPEWWEKLARALETRGSAIVAAPVGREADLAGALRRIAWERLDVSGLHLHARLVSIQRGADLIRAQLEIPEALQ